MPCRGAQAGGTAGRDDRGTADAANEENLSVDVQNNLPEVQAEQQSCSLLPKFGRPPEFGVFQEIAQKIAQNFLCYSRTLAKVPEKGKNG